MADAITAVSIMTAQHWIVEIERLRDETYQVSVYDPDRMVSAFHGQGDSVESAIQQAYARWCTPAKGVQNG